MNSMEQTVQQPSEGSYAQQLRRTLSELPLKKKCCAHAFRDALRLYEQPCSDDERADVIAHYEAHARCPYCVSHFVRALFCLHGSVTDPAKRYHLEFSFRSSGESEALLSLLAAQGMDARLTVRKNLHILYLKNGESIADFLAYMGANTAAFDFMNSRINREFRNTVNRQVNCDTANIEKALKASQNQIRIIRRMQETGALQTLPDALRETAELRIRYEQLSLKELGEMHELPITKSGVNHRLSRILDAAKAQGIE